MPAPMSMSPWCQSDAEISPLRGSMAGASRSISVSCWRFDPVRHTAQHAVYVGVEHRFRRAERETRDCRRGVGAYAGQPQQFRRAFRQPAAMTLHNLSGESVEAHSACVVAHAGPYADDVSRRSLSERLERRESLEERSVLGDDAIHLGLLKHHLRDEYRVGVGGAPPR